MKYLRALSRLATDYTVSHWMNIPRMPASPPPALNPSFDNLPPLPPIHDDAIHTRVFTHRSLYARPNHVFEDHPDDPSPDNEQFEHLGDTVLGFIVTGLLHTTYPNLRVGPCTKIRALMVGNTTLADISRRYQLPAQLRLHPAQTITLRASINIQANVFESYVGGLYLDQGLTTVQDWLKLLLKPYATEAYIRVRTEHGLPPLPAPVSPPLSPSTSTSSASPPPTKSLRYPPASGTPVTMGHLALFNQQIHKSKRDVEWVYDDCAATRTTTTPIWVVRVEVDGEIFGRGKGSNKKAARNEAAKEGLVRMGIVV